MSFAAKYPGACAHGDRIAVGDLCTYTEDDEIAHVECNTVDGPVWNGDKPDPSTVCPDCWTVHAGECA